MMARASRAIFEEVMLDIMFDLPSSENVAECVISEQVIVGGEPPVILYKNDKKSA